MRNMRSTRELNKLRNRITELQGLIQDWGKKKRLESLKRELEDKTIAYTVKKAINE